MTAKKINEIRTAKGMNREDFMRVLKEEAMPVGVVTDEMDSKIIYLKTLLQKNVAYAESAEKQRETDSSNTVDSLLQGMPSELMDLINAEIEFCLENNCDPVVLNDRVKKYVDLLNLAYKDSRKYLDMYARNYQELLLADFIKEICNLDYTEADWHRIARVNFNLNALRVVNKYGKEKSASGNELLTLFAETLKEGDTAKMLESLGIRVVPSAEGGDNFGWVLYGPYDLRLILSMAESMLLKEFESFNTDDLISMENGTFRMLVSIGSATLGEVLESLDITQEKRYSEITRMILNTMFKIADERAKEFKEIAKKAMKEENPELYALYAATNQDMLEERVRELEMDAAKV